MKYPVVLVSFLRVNGMALFPFILVKSEKLKINKVLVNHETIHLRQQIEMLVLPFYILYLLHYLINLIKYRNHYQAYMKIVFEKEAYGNEANLDYLKNRKFFAWINFL